MKTEAAGAGDERSERSSGMAGSGWLREGLWLASKEIRRSWLSYPASGLVWLLIGVLFGVLFDNDSVDVLFLLLVMYLANNWMSREDRAFWQDAISEWLIFMRSLPISQGALVGSRMISRCFALLFNVPALFIPLYLLSDLRHLGWSFVWFVLIWVGYSLLGAGLLLLGEFDIRGNNLWLKLALGVLMVSALLFLSVVYGIAGLAQSDGPLAAMVSLIAGAVGLALMARAATRGFERRDLST